MWEQILQVTDDPAKICVAIDPAWAQTQPRRAAMVARRIGELVRNIREPVLLAFSTATSEAA